MSNPPRPATRPAAGFEDREALRDLTTPGGKHTRMGKVLQGELSKGRLSFRSGHNDSGTDLRGNGADGRGEEQKRDRNRANAQEQRADHYAGDRHALARLAGMPADLDQADDAKDKTQNGCPSAEAHAYRTE